MPGIGEAYLDRVADCSGLAIRNRDTAGERLRHIVARERRSAGTRSGNELIDVRIFFLDASRIGEHDTDKRAGGGRAVDRASKPLTEQSRDIAAVIEMSVAEQQSIEGRGVEGEDPASVPDRIAGPSLDDTAVEQQA
jgi:hypothetical protein